MAPPESLSPSGLGARPIAGGRPGVMDTPAGEHTQHSQSQGSYICNLRDARTRPACGAVRSAFVARIAVLVPGGGPEGSKPQPAGECYLNRKGGRPPLNINSVPFVPPFAAR
jgi:hypothetical protein